MKLCHEKKIQYSETSTQAVCQNASDVGPLIHLLIVRFIPLLRHRDFWALDQVLRLCGIND